ncbi:MAG: fluoride efflux transporter CrcB [Candidatus Omnitrophica bacterium]|nr:fluoride efflux transporter CrcB [Candidatus Omnitrophota bacterium]MDD5429501.1 fluoride efflux transporter CrcB [Candidatus Omnitrophota bacterium]
MVKVLAIALGGAFGALLRYFTSGFAHRFAGSVFPWGTLSVNLLGSLLVGFFWGVFEHALASSNIKLFVFVGLLGAFTTFSTFTLETFNLLRENQVKIAVLNILANNIFCLFFVFSGFFVFRFLSGILR